MFFSFMVQMLAIPLPGEVIMGYVGYLVSLGKMNYLMSIIIVTVGLWVGITIAYYLGDRFGHPFFIKYGRYIHMGPERLEALSQWFGRYGNKVMIAGFFIPGIRHFTGFFAGIIEMPFRVFVIYSYIGSILFAVTFISLGKYLGADWNQYHGLIEEYISIAAVIIVVLLLIVYVFRYKGHIQDFIAKLLKHSAKRYNYSLLRVKIIAASILAVFFGLIILMVGIGQRYLSESFEQFNTSVALILDLIIDKNSILLKGAEFFTSGYVVAVAVMFGLFWIAIKSQERFLDMIFLFVTLLGGQALQKILQITFNHYQLTSLYLSFSFPSEQAFSILVLWGYFVFLFLRYNTNIHVWVRTLVTLTFITVVVMVGINHVIWDLETPRDVLAGYVLGTVWLFFNLILLEIVRLQTSNNAID